MGFPLSFREHHRNCAQEAGGTPTGIPVNIHSMESRFPKLRFTSQTFVVAGWLLMLILLVLEWLAGRASALAAVVVSPRITLVVFADHPISEPQWTTLATTLRVSFDNLAVETHFSAGGFEVVRGDSLAPGAQFEEVISIYVHGDCRLASQPGNYGVHGALGWVLRDQGQIRPFIHVDCARIAAVLGQRVLGLDKSSRDEVMAEAISRVILHEWLHIATQSPEHARQGIAKRVFEFNDLVPDYWKMIAPVGHGR
ncbi:MAG TPA: hypothetical protein VGL00_01240 [Terracidiphilus sp.]